MNIAFYAPLKPPHAPTPSGDRTMARALMAAMNARGHAVEVAARLRSRDPLGDPARQRRLRDVGARLADRLIRRYRTSRDRPSLWFTYHLYYKAPDWIGPLVAAALDIPYVLAEASYAPKRAHGPWHESHVAVGAAIARSDLVFGLNSGNEACVKLLLRDPGRLVPLRPFTMRSVVERSGPIDGKIRLLTVARMRHGAKLASFRLLADALRRVSSNDWILTIVGDGPAEADVRAAFDGLPVVFAGRQDPGLFYAAADLLVWPAVDEAFGMAIVEAQAAGLPVVCGYMPGIADTVRDGVSGLIVSQGDVDAFASALAELLQDTARRRAMGKAASAAAYGFDEAARLIDEKLRALV